MQACVWKHILPVLPDRASEAPGHQVWFSQAAHKGVGGPTGQIQGPSITQPVMVSSRIHLLLQSGSPSGEDRLRTPGTRTCKERPQVLGASTCNPRYCPPWSFLPLFSLSPSSMPVCLAAVAMGTICWLQGQGLPSHYRPRNRAADRQCCPVETCRMDGSQPLSPKSKGQWGL